MSLAWKQVAIGRWRAGRYSIARSMDLKGMCYRLTCDGKQIAKDHFISFLKDHAAQLEKRTTDESVEK